MFKKTTLKNGLRIITVPQKDTFATTILVLVGTGSKYETKKINGISHLLEHLLFKGTKKRPGQIAIAESLDRVGGDYNAFTGEEYTGYFAKVNAKHFDLALDIISDIYLNSKLDQKEIKKEKRVIIEEINMYYDHPSQYLHNLWNELLYGDQPAGWSIAGTKKSVLGISRQDVLDYINSQYVASNTVVCVAGNISEISKENKEPEIEVIEKLKKYFAKARAKKANEKVPVVERQTRPKCLLHKRATDQSHLCLGVRAYNLFHAQRYVQGVLGDILGGMMSSRLFIKVREELGAAYYVSTYVNSDTDTGFLVTQAGVDNKKVEKAISAILKEYKDISQKKVSSKELKKSKEHLKGKIALALETSDAKASFYGIKEILENRILTPKDIYDKIDKVTADDVLKVAKDIFQPRKLNLALIGPFKDKEKFQKLLKF